MSYVQDRRRRLNLGRVENLGDLICRDTFEDLFKWSRSGGAAGAAVVKQPFVAYYGDYSMGINTGTAIPDGYPSVIAYRPMYRIGHGRYRVEWLWTNRYRFRFRRLDQYMRFLGHDGYRAPGIGYSPIYRRWEYIDETGYYKPIPGSFQQFDDQYVWHRAAYEFDLNTEHYIRMISDDQETDLSDLAFYRNYTSYSEYTEARFWLWAATNIFAVVCVDEFVFMEI